MCLIFQVSAARPYPSYATHLSTIYVNTLMMNSLKALRNKYFICDL